MAKYRKLGRTSDQRKALLRSQVTSLIYKGKIVTTQARAKEVQKAQKEIEKRLDYLLDDLSRLMKNRK